jgi:hypothetical protein
MLLTEGLVKSERVFFEVSDEGLATCRFSLDTAVAFRAGRRQIALR